MHTILYHITTNSLIADLILCVCVWARANVCVWEHVGTCACVHSPFYNNS